MFLIFVVNQLKQVFKFNSFLIGRVQNNFRANRELIEKELYPKDLLDPFLECFILSLEDHKKLRKNENIRQKMARYFLATILQPLYVRNGSIQRLIMSMQRDGNHILKHVSKLMDSCVPHDILQCMGISLLLLCVYIFINHSLLIIRKFNTNKTKVCGRQNSVIENT